MIIEGNRYKDIKVILNFHFNSLKYMLPENLQEEFVKNAFISGGCIHSLFNNKEVNDYDFFIRDKDFGNRVREYFQPYATQQLGNIKTGNYKCQNLIISKYAITIGDYQIITRFVGEPEEVVEQFDFKHNMFAFIDGNFERFTDMDYLYDNFLHFNEKRARDICGTIMRVPKMINKGFKVTKKEMSKMLSKLNENGFDERELEILKDYTTY